MFLNTTKFGAQKIGRSAPECPPWLRACPNKVDIQNKHTCGISARSTVDDGMNTHIVTNYNYLHENKNLNCCDAACLNTLQIWTDEVQVCYQMCTVISNRSHKVWVTLPKRVFHKQ